MLLRNILLTLGGLTLVAGAILAVLWIRMPAGPANDQVNSRQPPAILIAADDIPAGTLLRASDMNWMIVEQSAIAPDDIVRGQVSEGSYVGAVARRHMAAGEPLHAGDLVRVSEANFLAAALTPGMQAVSLAVDASQSVSGLVQPGDRVDIVLLETAGDSSNTSTVGETVLRDSRVVAVDQWFNDQTKPVKVQSASADARIPRTITLELSAADAKRLLVASQLGRVTLVLRSLAGTRSGALALAGWSGPVWSSEFSAHSGRTPGRQPAAPRTEPGGRNAVLIMRGAKTETQ